MRACSTAIAGSTVRSAATITPTPTPSLSAAVAAASSTMSMMASSLPKRSRWWGA
jgi:hypothetical protein